MATVFLSLFLAFAVTNWWAAAKGRKDIEYVVKPAALVSLLLFAATGTHPSFWLAAALVLCLLGDVFMMLPDSFLPAGLTSFLLGHAAYILDIQAPLNMRLVWFAVVALAILPVAVRVVASVKAIGLKLGIVAYIGAIAFMTGSALASGSAFAAAGALLFLVSDALLAWDMFVKKIPNGHLLVMIVYHLGQLGLVLALR